MRGRPGCPTGQEKKPVGATGSNPLFYKERLGTESPPHPPQCAHWGTFPPRGRLWTWECLFPSEKPPPPARPAGGAGRYERWFMGRRPVSEHRKNLPLATNQREVGPGRREPLSALVFFPPTFSKESRAPPPESAGNPRCRVHPATVPTEPPTDDRGPPPGAGRATGRCAPRPRKSPDHGKGPYPGAGPLLRP